MNVSEEQPKGAERRQGARFATSFWVCVAGVDDGMQLRRGNISVSGIYFELDRSVGPPGSTCLLRISPSEDAEAVILLARVLGWKNGDFEFEFGDVDREDRIKTKTTALLLNLAIEQDEQSR